MRILSSILLLVILSFEMKAQDISKFKDETFIYKGDTLPVRVLYPKNFDATKKYPLVLFLHGRGESGNNNKSQLIHGSKLFLEKQDEFPAIVVFPQCSKDSYWANVNIVTDKEKGKRHFNFLQGGKPTKAMSLLLTYLKELKKLAYLDEDRFYLGGLSMGGMGTYEMLRRQPNTFTAAFAICGGDHVKNVRKYAHKVNLWIFHGAKDDVVIPEFSLLIHEELKRLGAKPKYTVYPDANHNSWDPAFKEPELLPWLFSNKK
ncbi:prolyl oligopeptidase family serine peptidase [Pedobacter glucosidilyticus]|uniref:carboxylesterase family protein n=1 Tax=Pedobacter glucosidilyticus TaxID=1122941 RepID=UPI0003F7C7A9|nr:prolyl oligopeptidase family serine peptidase [Pedobacter glucosidilyticus]